jgi:Xaa-Pro dipeptidase
MSWSRRQFVRVSAVVAGAAAAGCRRVSREPAPTGTEPAPGLPAPIRALRPMTGGVAPISDGERLARMERARELMRRHGIEAIYLEPGSSLFYFTGIRWGLSERMFAMVLPVRGEPAYVCPKFEEGRARELIRFGDDIRTWEEDESPYARVAQIFRDRGIRTGTVGIEERVRFFLFDGIRHAAPALTYVLADPVTAGCRMIKSPAELALMQRANDITIAAFRAVLQTLHEGMTPQEFAEYATAAHRALGVEGSISASFGAATAFPHGSSQPQALREGDVVLMDGGCSVEGYRSDITRTIVFGKPTPRQVEIWHLERRAQAAAFEAARPGVACEAVDLAARQVITEAGLGPDYRVPGLPHRTGHGIGLDGHEWTYLVRGNKTPLAPGMCFTDEPMIVDRDFGVRLEDAFYVTEDGARFFTRPSPSIDQPIAD